MLLQKGDIFSTLFHYIYYTIGHGTTEYEVCSLNNTKRLLWFLVFSDQHVSHTSI